MSDILKLRIVLLCREKTLHIYVYAGSTIVIVMQATLSHHMNDYGNIPSGVHDLHA
jgi:hypothetical protein